MNTSFFKIALLIILVNFANTTLFAQKPTIAVLNLDVKGIQNIDASQGGDLLRIELDKLQLFSVLDRYDVQEAARKINATIEGCYGTECLINVGNAAKADRAITGSAMVLGDNLIVALREINVGTARIEKTYTKEFLNLPSELKMLLSVALKEMYGLPTDTETVKKLTKSNNYESSVSVPDVPVLNLSGPRTGITVFTGNTAAILQEKASKGGYDLSYPLLFQCGYQFEQQYLNAGNFQALVEVLPMITGLDQGKVIPSLNIFNGFRNNKNGLEFAFGPSFTVRKTAYGYYDDDNKWVRITNDTELPAGKDKDTRLDSRGTMGLSSSFVVAVGKSFKSGKLNMPVNAYIIPGKDVRFGFSLGFNVRRN